MKQLFLLLTSFLLVACSSAQQYSTKNKKAIKLFEQGMQAPGQSVDPIRRTPNYEEGLRLVNAALDKDPNFWEAHLVAGEYCEYMRDYNCAIDHFEKALSIDPGHSPTGSTHFFLANLQQAVGKYDDAIKNIDLLERNRYVSPELIKNARQIRESCEFAIQAIQNPLDFNPINIGPGINTSQPEYFPTITVDGKTILFTRRIKDNRVRGNFKEQEDFFVSKLGENNIWGKAVAMPTNVNTVNNEGAPTIGADGRSLVFIACPDPTGQYGEGRTGKGSCDMYYTKKLGSRWTNPVNLPGLANTYTWESQPSLSSDGKTMYFVRRVSKRGEPNNSDIFVTRLLDNGQWSRAERLPGYINTELNEESVLIHPDGKTLYFASRGHTGMGGSDLFVCRMGEDGKWSRPENLGYPINTKFDENSLMVSPDGEIAFFASDREGGFGDLDIYYFEMPEKLRPTKTLYFEGLVYDIDTRAPIPGKFQLIDLKTGEEVVYSEADKITGEFMVSLPTNREYALNVSYPGYAFFSQNFDMKNPENAEAVHMDVPMVPLRDNSASIVLENVFFDLGKATLRKESFIELNKLVSFLKENPTVHIEISGHTDSRGSNNQTLSDRRAKSVYEYVVNKGISKDRMTHIGYGSSKPVYTDDQIASMESADKKEAAHQANRRTEYKITKR